MTRLLFAAVAVSVALTTWAGPRDRAVAAHPWQVEGPSASAGTVADHGASPDVAAAPNRTAPGRIEPLSQPAQLPARAPAQAPTPAPAVGTTTAAIATWSPEYTTFLDLTDADDLVEMELSNGTLWINANRHVYRYVGGAWSAPETVTTSGDVFSVIPIGTSGEAWAFGYGGGAWHRVHGTWLAVPSSTTADLYHAIARAADDVMAVGFDYESLHGVVVRFDGHALAAYTWPWLLLQQLYAAAIDATGEAWAGGCNGADRPFLMRDRGRGEWEPATAPDVPGCVRSISFAPDGGGLAATDGDILWWDGTQWHAFGQSPPEGFGWVRVASLVDTGGPTAVGPSPGWAVPGEATWRGYIRGQTPWYFDGISWAPTTVDYRGYDDLFALGAYNPNPRPFLDLVSDGVVTYSLNRAGSQTPQETYPTALMSLSSGSARLAHPLLERPASLNESVSIGSADIAALPDGDVYAGGWRGPAPLIHRRNGDWRVAPGAQFDGTTRFSVGLIDLASADAGWAVGHYADTAPARLTGWRWDGTTWTETVTPTGVRTMGPLRALPGGGAWATDRLGRLVTFEGASWVQLVGAPALDAPNDLPALRAPFDAVARKDGAVTAWAASRLRLHRYASGAWTDIQGVPRGVVRDLQLAEPETGWAIAIDTLGPSTRLTAGVLWHLHNGRWSEIDLTALLRALEASGELGPSYDYRRTEWRLLSPVGAREVWLHGVIGLSGVRPFLARVVLPADGASGEASLEVYPDCDIQEMSAVHVPGGTDVWLVGNSTCGPVPAALRRQIKPVVARLSVRSVVDTAWLPMLTR